MKFSFQAKKPVYLEIYRTLREEITRGTYPFGSKLPSKRLLAEEAGVSVLTVQHAYEILCDEGYARSAERSGYFVCYDRNGGSSAAFFGDVEKETAKAAGTVLEETPIEDITGDRGKPPYGFPFSVFAKAMRRVLSVYGEEILVKSPNTGCAELKSAIATYLARNRGMTVEPRQIVIGSGAEYLYGLALQLFGGDRLYAIESPSYEKIKQVYAANGVNFEELRMGKDGILTEDLERSEAEILHVSPYRSFPTGITASATKRQEYLRFAARRGGYLIEDDFDSEFTLSGKMQDTLYSLSENGRVLYINTFSRTVAPAMRVGYMILPAALLPLFREKLGFYSCTVPTFEQYVLAEFISSGDFERHINRVRRRIRDSRAAEK